MDHWASALEQHWGIRAKLKRLDGEYDLNFLAETPEGSGYVVKAMRPGCEDWLVDLQIQTLDHIAKANLSLPCPAVVAALSGEKMLHLQDDAGEIRLVWVIERLPGQCYAHAAPKTEQLIAEVGEILGATTATLRDFEHPKLSRDFKWDLMRADWVAQDLACIEDGARKNLIRKICDQYQALKPELDRLPQQAIHNDANDYNILVSGGAGPGETPHVSGLIDFGDMCAAPRICDLAIAAAYLVLDHPKPDAALAALVSGYHAINPLNAHEIDLLWPLLRMRLAVSVVNSTLMAAENPDDPYITISQGPAWRFLEGHDLNAGLMAARLRAACDLPVVDGADRVMAWLNEARGSFAPP